MLTTFDLVEYLLEALHAGVNGFALKETPPDDLVTGILAVARGDALVDPETTVRLIEQMTRRGPPAPPPAGLEQLTVLAKLGLRDRVQAVLVAHRSRLTRAPERSGAGIEPTPRRATTGNRF